MKPKKIKEIFEDIEKKVFDSISEAIEKKKAAVPKFLEDVDALDAFDKSKIYLHYCTVQMFMKNSCELVDTLSGLGLHGWGTPDRHIGNVAVFNLHKNTKTKTYEEFVSTDNISINDLGEKWKDQGFAQRYFVGYSTDSIYHWYNVLRQPKKVFNRSFIKVSTKKPVITMSTCGGIIHNIQ